MLNNSLIVCVCFYDHFYLHDCISIFRQNQTTNSSTTGSSFFYSNQSKSALYCVHVCVLCERE